MSDKAPKAIPTPVVDATVIKNAVDVMTIPGPFAAKRRLSAERSLRKLISGDWMQGRFVDEETEIRELRDAMQAAATLRSYICSRIIQPAIAIKDDPAYNQIIAQDFETFRGFSTRSLEFIEAKLSGLIDFIPNHAATWRRWAGPEGSDPFTLLLVDLVDYWWNHGQVVAASAELHNFLDKATTHVRSQKELEYSAVRYAVRLWRQRQGVKGTPGPQKKVRKRKAGRPA